MINQFWDLNQLIDWQINRFFHVNRLYVPLVESQIIIYRIDCVRFAYTFLNFLAYCKELNKEYINRTFVITLINILMQTRYIIIHLFISVVKCVLKNFISFLNTFFLEQKNYLLQFDTLLLGNFIYLKRTLSQYLNWNYSMMK